MSHRPLGVWQVASAGCSIPGTVRVSGKAAFSTGLPINTATVKGNLGNACVWSQIQLLLWRHRVGDYAYKKILFKTVIRFLCLFVNPNSFCVGVKCFALYDAQYTIRCTKLGRAFLQKLKHHCDIMLCPFCKRKLHPLPSELVCSQPATLMFLFSHTINNIMLHVSCILKYFWGNEYADKFCC